VDALIFAQVIGPVFLAISTLMITHKHAITETVDDIIDHSELQLSASLSPLLIGLTILLTTNPIQFTGDYLIYAIGILFLISGLFRLFFTSVWLKILCHIDSDTYAQIMAYSLLAYGILLTYHGYYIL
jgi:hypothetical protein